MIEGEKLLRGCWGAGKEEHGEMEGAQILRRETALQKSLVSGLDQGLLRWGMADSYLILNCAMRDYDITAHSVAANLQKVSWIHLPILIVLWGKDEGVLGGTMGAVIQKRWAGRNASIGEQARSFIASERRKQKKEKKKSIFGQSHQGGKWDT